MVPVLVDETVDETTRSNAKTLQYDALSSAAPRQASSSWSCSIPRSALGTVVGEARALERQRCRRRRVRGGRVGVLSLGGLPHA